MDTPTPEEGLALIAAFRTLDDDALRHAIIVMVQALATGDLNPEAVALLSRFRGS